MIIPPHSYTKFSEFQCKTPKILRSVSEQWIQTHRQPVKEVTPSTKYNQKSFFCPSHCLLISSESQLLINGFLWINRHLPDRRHWHIFTFIYCIWYFQKLWPCQTVPLKDNGIKTPTNDYNWEACHVYSESSTSMPEIPSIRHYLVGGSYHINL